jgi:hypothetical protein
MRMKRSAFALAAALALPLPASAQEVTRAVVVTNFPPIQRVMGRVDVSVAEPIPSAVLASKHEVVSPGSPQNPGSLTEGGVIEADGFTGVVLSLAGEMKGTLVREGRVGALLVPDQPELVKALRENGIVAFPLTVEARVVPAQTSLFTSDQPALRLAFPRYRVFFYNTTSYAAEVSLWVYLTTR